MRFSLQRRMIIGLAIALFAGVLTAGYVLLKFHSYEGEVARVLSGDQRSVLLGRLVQARVAALEELVQASVSSQEADEQFRKKIRLITDDLKALGDETPDKSLDESIKTLKAVVDAKGVQVEDLFFHYRNLKTSVFNLYRASWANKWMTVAKHMSLVLNDLENLPYHSADKAAAAVNTKIGNTVSVVTHSILSKGTKLYLFNQLSSVRELASKYNEALQKADKLKTERLAVLKSVSGKLQRYNEAQGKSLVQFGNQGGSVLLLGLIAVLLYVLFAFGWFHFVTRRFGRHVAGVMSHMARQLAGWVTTGGAISAQGFKEPERSDAEFKEVYQILDQTIRRMNALRKEDILVKRLLNVPFLLVNRSRQAMFWNSALSILGKIRALEETGPSPYRNLLRFTDANGHAVDPVDRAFAENKEVTQLALLKVGTDGIAVYVVCTPVMGADDQPEYVMVHIRDLREENRRFEAELDRQLTMVRQSLQQIKSGKLPGNPAPDLRKPAAECVQLLRAFALDLQEKNTVLTGQIGTLSDRMAREAGLKKSVHGRMEQLREEVSGLREQLELLREQAGEIAGRLGVVDTRSKALRGEYADMKRRGSVLLSDLRRTEGYIGTCIEQLANAEKLAERVRANERVIRSIVEKSAMLNANNSILGAKRDLTPTDVATVTENITALMGQFERSYRFIEQSVEDIETNMSEIGSRLREGLNACLRLAADESALLKGMYGTEKGLEETSRQAVDFTQDVNGLQNASELLARSLAAVEAKVQRLVQIGQASIELQSQLEIGFKGISEHVGVKRSSAADH